MFYFWNSEIGEAFKLLGDDPDCRVIIFSGNGKAFCAGTIFLSWRKWIFIGFFLNISYKKFQMVFEQMSPLIR